jgi:cold shock protein
MPRRRRRVSSLGLVLAASLSNYYHWRSHSLNPLCQATPQRVLLVNGKRMPEGKIKRLTDKGFGFIEDGSDKDMFFHSSNVEGTSFEQLREGQRVSYTEGRGPKGPRAENVKPI